MVPPVEPPATKWVTRPTWAFRVTTPPDSIPPAALGVTDAPAAPILSAAQILQPHFILFILTHSLLPDLRPQGQEVALRVVHVVILQGPPDPSLQAPAIPG